MNLRLAFRHEGVMWNAYLSSPGDMTDAVLLGSIAMREVLDNEEHKEMFMQLMMSVVGAFIKRVYGNEPQNWAPQTAPEHERSGHG